MEKMIRVIVDNYVNSNPDKTEEELEQLLKQDLKVAQLLSEARILASRNKAKESLDKTVDAMDIILQNAGIDNRIDRLKIIQKALMESTLN